ncbi:MAG: hypothetical protein WBL74_00630 [Novosphingobium sp.]
MQVREGRTNRRSGPSIAWVVDKDVVEGRKDPVQVMKGKEQAA